MWVGQIVRLVAGPVVTPETRHTQTRKKPKDLSEREREERGRGEGAGGNVHAVCMR